MGGSTKRTKGRVKQAAGQEHVMSTLGWIILILVLLLLFGGFGYSRRR